MGRTMNNQGWRKKPRMFAPKSRLGCKTCKIRRIKCDLAQPSCLKCLSTGRICDGYPKFPLVGDNQIASGSASTSKGFTSKSDHPSTRLIAKQSHSKSHASIPQPLRPLMSPVTRSTEAEAMHFFQHVSIKHMNEYRPWESWRRTLLIFSQTVPPVRHAAIALAMIQRKSLDHHSGSQEHHIPCVQDLSPDKSPLIHYNRAIQLLLNQGSGDSLDAVAVTLVVCYLFTCFEHLAGNNVQALEHLRGGVELSCNITSTTYGNPPDHDTRSSGIHAILCQAVKQIRRLDLQAGMILVDWSPISFKYTHTSAPSLLDSVFYSLDQAADELQILVTQTMRLHNTQQQTSQTATVLQVSSSPKDWVLGRLEKWSRVFGAFTQQSNTFQPGIAVGPLVPLLRLQCTIAWVLLSSFGPGTEMNYDNFLHQLQQCIALAKEVAMAHRRCSESPGPTFTPELGLIPILYIIGVKCRHPILRREVLSILRQQVIQESTWDSTTAARVVDRVIEIEEATVGPGERVQSMEQVPAWQRIRFLSFAHVSVGHSVTKVDIMYRFCAGERIHLESLG